MEKSPLTVEQMKSEIKFMVEAYDKGYMTWRKIKKKLMEMVNDDEGTTDAIPTPIE